MYSSASSPPCALPAARNELPVVTKDATEPYSSESCPRRRRRRPPPSPTTRENAFRRLARGHHHGRDRRFARGILPLRARVPLPGRVLVEDGGGCDGGWRGRGRTRRCVFASAAEPRELGERRREARHLRAETIASASADAHLPIAPRAPSRNGAPSLCSRTPTRSSRIRPPPPGRPVRRVQSSPPIPSRPRALPPREAPPIDARARAVEKTPRAVCDVEVRGRASGSRATHRRETRACRRPARAPRPIPKPIPKPTPNRSTPSRKVAVASRARDFGCARAVARVRI